MVNSMMGISRLLQVIQSHRSTGGGHQVSEVNRPQLIWHHWRHTWGRSYDDWPEHAAYIAWCLACTYRVRVDIITLQEEPTYWVTALTDIRQIHCNFFTAWFFCSRPLFIAQFFMTKNTVCVNGTIEITLDRIQRDITTSKTPQICIMCVMTLSSLMFPRKANSKLHICLDPKALNEVMIREKQIPDFSWEMHSLAEVPYMVSLMPFLDPGPCI